MQCARAPLLQVRRPVLIRTACVTPRPTASPLLQRRIIPARSASSDPSSNPAPDGNQGPQTPGQSSASPPSEPAWDHSRGFGWAKFWGIWVIGVALAFCLPSLLSGLSDMLGSVHSHATVAAKNVLLLQAEFILDKLSKMHLITKILFVLAGGMPLVLAFGFAFHVLTGTPMQPSLQRFYLLIFRLPGMSVINDKTWSAVVTVNLAYYIGLFVYAIFLGVVTDEVKTTFKSIKGGLLPVRESGHTLLLNWNKYTPLVLQTLATAKKQDPDNAFYQRPVAVLAEKPKAEMDAVLKGLDLVVHARTGSPTQAKDLLKVGADKASAILVLQPEGKRDPGDAPQDFNSKAQVAATAMVLSSMPSNRTHEQHLVLHQAANIQHDASTEFLSTVRKTFGSAYSKAGGLQVAAVSRHAIAQRFQALSAIQPGIVKIYTEIFSPWGATLSAAALPESLDGATYQQVRRSFDECVVCGFIRDGKVNLLPGEMEVMKSESDTLVVLTRSSKPLAPSADAVAAYEQAKIVTAKAGKAMKHAPLKVLVVATSPAPVAALSEVFAQFAQPGTTVTYLLPSGSKAQAQALSLPSGNCKFSLQYAQDPASVKALCDAGIKDADSVVITGIASSDLPLAEADHCTMAVMLQVQEAVRASGRTKPPHVVARVRATATATAISDFLASIRSVAPPEEQGALIRRPDVLQVEQLIGSLLAQAASSKYYLPIVQHLLSTSEGAEVYLRNPQEYGLPAGGSVTLASAAEHARQYNETVIGYSTASGKMVLAPEASHMIPLEDDCRLVSFAADFNVSKAKSA